MVFNAEPYRLAISKFLADHGLAPEPRLVLHSRLPLGIFGRRALLRVTANMEARNNAALYFGSKAPFPGVKRTGLLTAPVRAALIPPKPKGGYSACTEATFAGCDQGVDFTGKGNIYALADGVVTRVEFNTGWPGAGGPGTGTIVVYRMTSGPRNGQYVYVAEAIIPAAGLKTGDHLGKGQRIGSLDSGYPGIEVGFAQNAHGDAFGSTQDGKPGGPDPVHGREMLAFIKQLSA